MIVWLDKKEWEKTTSRLRELEARVEVISTAFAACAECGCLILRRTGYKTVRLDKFALSDELIYTYYCNLHAPNKEGE